MGLMEKDKQILRELGRQYAQIAHLDQQSTNKKNWKTLNALGQAKPMVMIDQIPWHEMNINDELTLQCEDGFCRGLEQGLKRTIYKWKHMHTDMVIEPYIQIGKVVHSTGIGVDIHQETASVDVHNDVVAHKYLDQLENEEDLEKLHKPILTYDEVATKKYEEMTNEIFTGILPVRLVGRTPNFRVWDQLAMYRGVTPLLMDMIDRPEFIHATMEKLTEIELSILDQCEALNLLEADCGTIHCSGAQIDELPGKTFDPNHVKGTNCWASGMGQIFSSCSPDMHDEFEIAYAKKYYERCGLVYYGCCEPLHNKIDIIRQIPNVRKISISPWADPEIAARNMGRDYVLSRKPNPAFVATQTMDEEQIKREIVATLEASKKYGTPCEFILKDISTVAYKPERLFRWSELVQELIAQYY